MENSTYWKSRFEQLEQAANQVGVEFYQSAESQYYRAQRSIEGQISSWYQRFAANNKISMEEARKLLNTKELAEFRWDVQEYIKHGEQNALDPTWMKQLENASARFHISRLEALKYQTQQSMEVLFGNQSDGFDTLVKRIYSDRYYHTAFEIQKGFGVGWEVASIDQNRLEKIISKPWAVDGKNFSDRIWQNKTKLTNELHTELTQMCMLGKAPDTAIKNIAKKMNASRVNAGSLVMTESAYFASASQKDAFKELGVERFEVVATLDSSTSKTCQELDGKVFIMKDYEPGVTAPPFHVRCRSTTIPYFDDGFNAGERAARGEDGKTYYLPASTKYPDWKKAFVEGDTNGLQEADATDTMKGKQDVIQDLEKLKKSGMTEDEYTEYLSIINNHDNSSIRQLYSKHGDEIKSVKKLSNGGEYSPGLNTIEFSYPKYDGMSKYGTLAHEYGHFFDAEVSFDGVHFKEIEAVRKATSLNVIFRNVASSSDEFLEAMRKDKAHIKSIFTLDLKADLLAHNTSHGVQDAIDGLFPKSRIKWGHGERYYNRKYANIEFMDKLAKTSRKKDLQQVYKDLGFDASSQEKVKAICRQYEAASEAWANIMSAEVCGGEDLEYIKEYLPHSYQTMVKILKGGGINE